MKTHVTPSLLIIGCLFMSVDQYTDPDPTFAALGWFLCAIALAVEVLNRMRP